MFQFSLYLPRLEKANSYFTQAVIADPQDAKTLAQYGQFLSRCGESSKALQTILRALEVDCNHIYSLHQLEQLLERQNMPIYYATYKFKRDKLIEYEFGFEYP